MIEAYRIFARHPAQAFGWDAEPHIIELAASIERHGVIMAAWRRDTAAIRAAIAMGELP